MKINYLSSLICFIIFISCSYGQSSYSIQRTMDFLYYQKVSYCPSEQIEQWNCGTICKFHDKMKDIRVLVNSTNESQGYMGYDNGNIVIAFRGSRLKATNWINNFDFAKVNYPRCPKCQVHRGFYRTFMDLSSQMFLNLEELLIKYPKASITITGHSLGGAVATIAAIEVLEYIKLQGRDIQISEMQTFGQPRVGNTEFVAYFNERLPFALRIVNNRDIVVRMPMRLFGFTHIGTEVWYTKENNFTICLYLSEDPKCSISFAIGSVFDHVTYLNNKTGCQDGDMQTKPECIINGVNVCFDDNDEEEGENDEVIPKKYLMDQVPLYISKSKQVNE